MAIVCAIIEDAADRASLLSEKGPLPGCHRGRGSFKLRRIDNPPGRNPQSFSGKGYGKSGDWVQLRAISNAPSPAPRAQLEVQATWRAIVSAKGFKPSFPEWWLNEHDQPFYFQLPNVDGAHNMYSVLRQDERQWRNVATAKRRQVMSRFFMDDWAEGGSKHFAAVKDPEAPVVNSVDQISHTGIIACRQYRKGHLKIKVQREDLQLRVPGTGLHQGKSVATIVQIDRGHVFAKVDRGVFKTGPAHLAKPTSDATAVQKEAERFWRSF